jgi:hypothetical protein
MRLRPGFFELAPCRGREVVDIGKTWLRKLDTVFGYWKDHQPHQTPARLD